MSTWDNFINTAMIGTGKKTIAVQDMPVETAEAAARIASNDQIDQEEIFLQLAALAFNYRQAGVMPVNNENISITAAPEEEKAYCSIAAIQALKDILLEESIPLLQLWLQRCADKSVLVTPDMVPVLFDQAVYHKQLQLPAVACCGKRGKWLSGFNDTWKFSASQDEEQVWQTGTTEQRKSVLLATRKQHPEKALEWLQQTWPQEDAAGKTVFLEVLSASLSNKDIAFLESLSGEKSKKVKESANRLLKQIPGSAIVQQYQDILEQSVTLKKEKALLGLSSKQVIQINLALSDDHPVYKTGIEKLSSNKAITDDEHVISQLMQAVPPSFWETHFNSKPETIIEIFQKDAAGKKLLPALVQAISNFRDSRWAIAFMQYSDTFYIDIIPLLPAGQQHYYSIKFFDKYPDDIIRYAIDFEDTWSLELTQNIFKHAARHPYQYQRSFFNQHIHLIPAPVTAQLEKCAPPEEHYRKQWSNTSDYITKLLTLKHQVIQSFNS